MTQISKLLTNNEVNWEAVKYKYQTAVQTKVLCADTKNLVVEGGRGIGKTTQMFGARVVRISYSMPQSIMMLVGPTYTFLMETVVSEIVTYLLTHYTRGIQFEYGRKPPDHFKRPYTEVIKWNHTISFAWGTVIQFGSMDRPESFVGKNLVHIVADEMLRIKETDFRERAVPALRADKTIFGGSPYFKGMTMSSSTPNFDSDNDFWLEYAKHVNTESTNEIIYVAYRVLRAGGQIAKLHGDIARLAKEKKGQAIERKKLEIAKLNRFIARWEAKLNVQRHKKKNWWFYMKATTFSNLAWLGLDYMEQQLMLSGENYDKFNLSILCIRPSTIKNPFFPHFNKKHIYSDEYRYDYNFGDRGQHVDDFSIENILEAGGFNKNSLDLKYCDPDKSLLMGYDPGDFQSATVAQKNRSGKTEFLNFLKDFVAWVPEEHAELAEKFDKFFKNHRRKTIYLYPDRAAYKKVRRYRENPKGKTDLAIFVRELEDRDWTVHVEGEKRTIFYWEHYMLWAKLLKENSQQIPHLRFGEFECESLISSIRHTGKLPSAENWIEMDKTPEKKLDFSEQAMFSPQLASAATYLVFGLYPDLKPEAAPDTIDFAML